MPTDLVVLTADVIEALPPGIELDRLVATVVFGLEDVVEPDPYSTHEGQALDVFWQMIENCGGGSIETDMEDYGREPGHWCLVTFRDREGDDVIISGEFAPTICRTALIASLTGPLDADV